MFFLFCYFMFAFCCILLWIFVGFNLFVVDVCARCCLKEGNIPFQISFFVSSFISAFSIKTADFIVASCALWFKFLIFA